MVLQYGSVGYWVLGLWLLWTVWTSIFPYYRPYMQFVALRCAAPELQPVLLSSCYCIVSLSCERDLLLLMLHRAVCVSLLSDSTSCHHALLA